MATGSPLEYSGQKTLAFSIQGLAPVSCQTLSMLALSSQCVCMFYRPSNSACNGATISSASL